MYRPKYLTPNKFKENQTNNGFYSSSQQEIIPRYISLDSRNKKAGDKSGEFTLSLGGDFTQIKAVQLASIYIPRDHIRMIDDSNTLSFSEPMEIPVSTTLDIQETTKQYNKITKNIVTTTTHTTVSITIPPTLNSISSVLAAGTTVTTVNDHGVQFVLDHYSVYNLRMTLVAGLYYNVMPAVNSTNVSITTGVTSSTTFDFNAGYLNTINTGNHDLRNGNNSTRFSYLYADKPTITELLGMLNLELKAIYDPINLSPSGATTILLHQFEIDDRNNRILFHAPSIRYEDSTYYYIVTSQVVDNTNSIATMIGYTSLPFSCNSVQRDQDDNMVLIGAATGNLEDLPFVRVCRLTPGATDPLTFAPILQQRMTPLDLTTSVAAQRTLALISTGGDAVPVELYRGRYTGSQLATHMQTRIRSETSDTSFTVTYNQDATTGDGTFTFAHSGYLYFGLDFTNATIQILTNALGFQVMQYSGSYTYTSPYYATTSVLPGTTVPEDFPTFAYDVQTDFIRQVVQIGTRSEVNSIVSVATTGTTYQWELLDDDAGDPLVPGLRANEVIQVQVTGSTLPAGVTSGDVVTAIVSSVWDGVTNDPNPYITVINTTSLSGTAGGENGIGNPNGAGVAEMHIIPYRRGVFQLHCSSETSIYATIGFPPQTLPTNSIVSQYNQNPSASPNETYDSYPTTAGAATIFESPYIYNFDSPEYILVVLSGHKNGTESTAIQHVSNDFHLNGSLQDVQHSTANPILAKVHLRSPTHTQDLLFEPIIQTMDRNWNVVKIELRTPDWKLVDLHGGFVSLSLLFHVSSGVVVGPCR